MPIDREYDSIQRISLGWSVIARRGVTHEPIDSVRSWRDDFASGCFLQHLLLRRCMRYSCATRSCSGTFIDNICGYLRLGTVRIVIFRSIYIYFLSLICTAETHRHTPLTLQPPLLHLCLSNLMIIHRNDCR